MKSKEEMKSKKNIIVKPKELDLELGTFKIVGKAREGCSVFTGEDIIFTIDGKPYQDVIGYVRHMTIDIGTSEEIVTIRLTLFPRGKKK